MYRRILIPTDGSELCRSAASKGIEFARESGAEVVAFHAVPATSYMLYTESGPSDLMVEQFEKEARTRGELDVIVPACIAVVEDQIPVVIEGEGGSVSSDDGGPVGPFLDGEDL